MSRRSFGRYKIIEEVGRGAMGVVYRATDPVVSRTVALKAINQSYLEGVGVHAAEYLERFRREAEVAGRLNHPNIVKIFDLGPDYLVMEFVEGESLAALLQARKRLPPDHILRVVDEVAAALDHAHGMGIVHRDVKPGNIMIQPDGTAKVMDFGLARIESSTLTAAGEILGSASYMAPEVVLGEQADARADIFSLGVVAYELMTGDRPFSGASVTVIIQNIVKATPRPAHQINLHLPPEDDAIFEQVLAKDPAKRYPRASDFARELALRQWAEPEAPAAATRGLASAGGIADDGAATIPPGVRPTVPRPAPPRAPEADESEPTLMVADADELESAEEDSTSRTVVMADAGEIGGASDRGVVELPAESLEPLDDDARLQRLLSAQTLRAPASDVSTATQAPDAEIARAARAAAATGFGPSDVLGEDQPAAAAPAAAPAPPAADITPAVAPPVTPPVKKGLPIVALAALAAAVLLAATLGLSVFAYRALLRRALAPGAASPSAAPAEAATPAEPPPTPTPSIVPVPTTAAREPTPTPSVRPAPVLATLTVSSEPAGAKVTLGRTPRGKTPLRLQLAPGKIVVLVEKEGFQPWRREVALAAAGLALEARLEPTPVAEVAPPPTPAGPKAGDLVPLGPDVTPPRKLSGDPPRLPNAASKLKLSGSVLLQFVVDEEGRVVDPKVDESGGEILDAACLEAIRTWRYQPATTQGLRVKVVQRAKFSFQIR